MNCYLCGSTGYTEVKGQVRDNPSIGIRKCAGCGLVYLDDSSHVDCKFYLEDGMGKNSPPDCDFAQVDEADTQKRFMLHSSMLKNKKVLDFGCGKGSFLTSLKKNNVTSELYALEPNQKHSEYLNSSFTLFRSTEEIPNESFDFITMFHVLEHLCDPIGMLNTLYSKLKIGGSMIIEVPNSEDVLLSLYENDAFSKFTYWSCHLYLFNNETLRYLLEKTPYKIDYIKQYQRYSFANHMYWLSKGKPGGHNEWGFLDDINLQTAYEEKLAEIGKCDTLTVMISR